MIHIPASGWAVVWAASLANVGRLSIDELERDPRMTGFFIISGMGWGTFLGSIALLVKCTRIQRKIVQVIEPLIGAAGHAMTYEPPSMGTNGAYTLMEAPEIAAPDQSGKLRLTSQKNVKQKKGWCSWYRNATPHQRLFWLRSERFMGGFVQSVLLTQACYIAMFILGYDEVAHNTVGLWAYPFLLFPTVCVIFVLVPEILPKFTLVTSVGTSTREQVIQYVRERTLVDDDLIDGFAPVSDESSDNLSCEACATAIYPGAVYCHRCGKRTRESIASADTAVPGDLDTTIPRCEEEVEDALSYTPKDMESITQAAADANRARVNSYKDF